MSSLLESCESLAVRRSTYVPATLKDAVVDVLFAAPNVTVPGPLTLLHVMFSVLPDGKPPNQIRTPIINYPYARVRPIIDRLRRAGDIDRCHGARVRYANPWNGGWATPTMGAHLALLPRGFEGEPYRSTDGTIFVCVEGEGATKLDEETLEWSPGDVFVIPPWKRYAHRARGETVLFGISDRPAQQALGIWREDR